MVDRVTRLSDGFLAFENRPKRPGLEDVEFVEREREKVIVPDILGRNFV